MKENVQKEGPAKIAATLEEIIKSVEAGENLRPSEIIPAFRVVLKMLYFYATVHKSIVSDVNNPGKTLVSAMSMTPDEFLEKNRPADGN